MLPEVEKAWSLVPSHLRTTCDEVLKIANNLSEEDLLGLRYVNDYADYSPMLALLNKYYPEGSLDKISINRLGGLVNSLFIRVWGYKRKVSRSTKYGSGRVVSVRFYKE